MIFSLMTEWPKVDSDRSRVGDRKRNSKTKDSIGSNPI